MAWELTEAATSAAQAMVENLLDVPLKLFLSIYLKVLLLS
jgi:hypothetical protein